MNPTGAAVHAALVHGLARMAAVSPPPSTAGALRELPRVVAPAWQWTADEALCAAAQVACYEAACVHLLPALAAWGRAADRAPLANLAAQTVRNALAQLRELPLVSAGRAPAEAVTWHLLTAHQLKFALAADARMGPLALFGYVAALQTVAATLGEPPNDVPEPGDLPPLVCIALTRTWHLADRATAAAAAQGEGSPGRP
ncbi:MAG: hypothetical protein FJ100_08805 [Deltaproteobacteria bacterium]|nr:hypothetical protein [Deltaproteobacteria bacterium]